MLTKRPPSAFVQFLHSETTGGILLLIASAAALFAANSNLHEWYEHFRHLTVAIDFGEWTLSYALDHWINDGLMVVFFFLVGLEIKREILVGELSSPKKAALAVFAALGGMLIPAAIYAVINVNHPEMLKGWGIPMATDIAFALGVLSLLGKRVPFSLKIFLAALAIVDDLGAILVIAVFYTNQLDLTAFALSLLCVGVSFLYARRGGRRGPVFFVIGVLCWYFMLRSGIHATIAGVLMALTVPTRIRVDLDDLNHRLQLDVKEHGFELNQSDLLHMERIVQQAESPLHRFERFLHPWVGFAIMPLFAFFNAGVVLPTTTEGLIDSPEVQGIFFGLVFGKAIGVIGASWLAVKFKVAELPEGVNWASMVGIGFLAGLGFTMSLFIAVLAFSDAPDLLEEGKIAILAGSITAAVIGASIMLWSTRKSRVSG